MAVRRVLDVVEHPQIMDRLGSRTRPAGAANIDTLPATSMVEINFKSTSNAVNDGKPIRLKLSQIER